MCLDRYWDAAGLALLLGWFWWRCGMQPLLQILCAAAVHELGHLLTLKLLRAPAGTVRLSPTGAVIFAEDLTLSYPAEILAVLAGPAANLLTAYILGNGFGVYAMAGAHGVLGVFNLLPAASLDGGRCLQLLLGWWQGPDRGERIAGWIGGIAALALAAALLWVVFRGGGAIWLLPAVIGLSNAGIRAIFG